MAIVLKPPVGASKGVALFTHKERRFLDLDAPVLGPALQRLRARYFVLMHWGWHAKDVPSVTAVDAHVCRKSSVTFRDPNTRRIPMNSAMFTPRYFRPLGSAKQWDVISVTRATKAKRTGELLDCMRIVMTRRPQTTALVICTAGTNPSDPNAEHGLYERYLAMFSEEERERFTFLHAATPGLFLFSRRDIAFLYNSSRAFTLFSDAEGGSKVIKEALVCGLPVLVKKHLLGGGRDFLNDANSRQFSGASDGAEHLIAMLDHLETFRIDTGEIADQMGEAANIPRFVAAVRSLFDEAGVPFEGELDTDNLSRKLPSHLNLLPSDMRSPSTDDLRSAEAALRYVRGVTDGVPFGDVVITAPERLLLRAFERSLPLRGYIDAARRRLQLK